MANQILADYAAAVVMSLYSALGVLSLIIWVVEMTTEWKLPKLQRGWFLLFAFVMFSLAQYQAYKGKYIAEEAALKASEHLKSANHILEVGLFVSDEDNPARLANYPYSKRVIVQSKFKRSPFNMKLTTSGTVGLCNLRILNDYQGDGLHGPSGPNGSSCEMYSTVGIRPDTPWEFYIYSKEQFEVVKTEILNEP
jgi:hypothetical protein